MKYTITIPDKHKNTEHIFAFLISNNSTDILSGTRYMEF